LHLKNLYKGAKPIEKNVIVVDEQGNEYEAANYITVSNEEHAIAQIIADIESGKMRF
jgi:hypothetical protein